jgi:hypothetical protein
MVDLGDSKSPARKGVPVRVRPLVPSFFNQKFYNVYNILPLMIRGKDNTVLK